MRKEILFSQRPAFALVMLTGNAGAQTGPVRVGLDVDAGTLDPRLARDTSAYRVADLIYDGLVRLSPDLKPEPNLAQSWENPDPQTWIFKLRDGVTFHDGTPLTADDVVFTYQTILKPEMNAPLRGLFTPISKVEAIDASTVKFTLSAPYSPLLSYLEMGIVPKKAVEGGADLALEADRHRPDETRALGPRQPDRACSRTRNTGPALRSSRRLQLVVIGDNTARAQAFEAKDLDLIQSPLSPQDIKRLQGNSAFTRRHHLGPRRHLSQLQHRRSGGLGPEDAPRARHARRPEHDRRRALSGRRPGRELGAAALFVGLLGAT